MSISLLLFCLAPLLSLLIEGIRRKLVARFQGRIGPPILQPTYDFLKLMYKQEQAPEKSDPLIFFFCPIAALFFCYLTFFFLFGILSFRYDFILLIYLYLTSSTFYLLCGLASPSPYTRQGAMRELLLMLLYELLFFACVFNFFLKANASSISEFSHILPLHLPFSSIGLIALPLILYKITPFEIQEAMTEVIAGPITEHCSRSLALIKLTDSMKLFSVLYLISFLLAGFHAIAFLSTFSFLFLLSTFSSASAARLRVDQACKLLFIFLLLSLIELCASTFL